ncbi:MAG: formylglycine-generating enzyme family protein [Planctomycetota bacterium]|nr:formylglycine-generating enzyme family protein [Planctomycetota bacterium]
MRNAVTALLIICGVAAVTQAEQLKVPDGCRPAQGAKPGPEGYADRIIHGKTGIELILMPAGEFEMGSGKGAYQVTIGAPFYMGKTEVTNAQYRRFVEATGYDAAGDLDPDPDYDMYLRHWRGKSIMSSADDYPVVWVNWKNVKAFCQWAGLALPSDAQWEYACRAGTTTPYYFGEDEKEFAKYGWSNTSREYHTHSVAGKLPNTWGLYDMLGNVREWVEDDYVSNEYVELSQQPWWQRTRYAEPPTDGSARLEGRMTKILRGGSWGLGTVVCRSDSRYNYAPTNAGAEIGFRAVLALDK